MWSTPCLKGRPRPCICARVRLALKATWSNPRAMRSGRGETSVPQSPNGQSGNQSSVAPSSDLGANEWLVEEMKEQYDKDPASVGPEWAAYFGNGTAPAAASCRRRGRRAAAPPPEAAAAPGACQGTRPGTREGPGQGPGQGPGRSRREGRRDPPAPEVDPAPRGRRRRAGQGHQHPGRQGPEARRARSQASDEPTYTVLRGAPGPHRRQHGRLADGPDRHLGALGAGQAAVGQPHGHQQPPRPRPRRQGLLHPHHRLRAGQGAEVDAGDERRLRGRRRQAQPDHPGPHQPRPGDRHAEARRHPPAARPEHQGRRDDGLRRLLDGLRGDGPQGARQQARPSPTSRAPRCR